MTIKWTSFLSWTTVIMTVAGFTASQKPSHMGCQTPSLIKTWIAACSHRDPTVGPPTKNVYSTQYPGMVGEQTKIHYLHTTTKVDITQAQWIIKRQDSEVDKVVPYQLVVSLPRRCFKQSRWTIKVRWATSNQRFLLGFRSWWYAPHRPVVLWSFCGFRVVNERKPWNAAGLVNVRFLST